MLTRRDFLKRLLSSVAAAALAKNGVVQPDEAIAEPKRRVFDMAANTWRKQKAFNYWVYLGDDLATLKLPPLRSAWPMETGLSIALRESGAIVGPVYWKCQPALTSPLRITQELLDDARTEWSWSGTVKYTAQWYEQLENAYQKSANDLS